MDRRSPSAPHLVAVNAGVAKLARLFSAPVRQRAAQYVGTGRVEIIRDTDTDLHANVMGTDYYVASFERSANAVDYGCTCPFFASQHIGCKHLWALVLEAANGVFMRAVAGCDQFAADGIILNDEDELLDDDDDELEESLSKTLAAQTARDWRSALAAVQHQSVARTTQLHYFLPRSALRAAARHGVRVTVGQVDLSRTGAELTPGARLDVRSLVHDLDRELYLLMVAPALLTQPYGAARHVVNVPAASFAMVLPKLAASGRCHFVPDDARDDDTWQSFSAGLRSRKSRSHTSVDYDELLGWPKLGCDPGGDWRLCLSLAHAEGAAPTGFLLRGELERGETTRPVSDVAYVDADGNVIIDDGLSSCAQNDAVWIERLIATPELPIPSAELQAFVEHAGGARGPARFRLPEEYRTLDGEKPRPVLEISRPAGQKTYANVFFEYSVARVPARSAANLVFVEDTTALVRQRAEEGRHEGELVLLGFRGPLLGDRSSAAEDVSIQSKALPEAIRRLLHAGWSVYAEGKRLRASRSVKVAVKSGIDWFEVNGSAEFEGASLPFPALLAAVKRKQQMVELGDGSFGVLPEEWLSRWGVVAELVSDKGGLPRFSSRQVGVLQTLVSVEPDVAPPAALTALASKLEQFHAVATCDPPEGFVGELREYQRVGLGWLQTLRDLSLGACLADDMGLGKTVQLIAHLLACRRSTTATRPALVVAPRSLVVNWQAELARFAPALRVYAHHGPDRDGTAERWETLDVVITTYATLRLDIALLSGVDFDTVVLDEAQSIKNDDSATAKCAKRLKAAHRIALSGTPIENHLGELWSLFEFLNPGLLDELPALKKSLDSKKPSPEALALITKVVRPFVLRRTKAEVAKDLPERVEQTLYVDLDAEQRAHYDEILRHYQASVKKKLSREPAARATTHVLEALLRLRQAACHPGLLDSYRSDESSAKVDVLLSRLRALSDEGHKVLVFSQFTSLLAIVRRQLEREGLAYAYLDGKTVDRAGCVERFQSDPTIGVFLISLKAGGVGLNLTAADYVFILDPWWNPAVEAQAIDRAHRIGQTRTVIAYRLLARNTVEERLVELQRQKRDLAAAIFSDGSALSGRLTREDLQQLLDLS